MPKGVYKKSLAHRHKIRLNHIGDKNPQWKGDKAKRVALHQWIRNKYGKAGHCENNPLHKARRYEWANIKGHKYTRNIEDYKQLCVSCHGKMDRWGKYCKRGHKRIPKNIYIYPSGKRQCRICLRNNCIKFRKNNKDYNKKWRLKNARLA